MARLQAAPTEPERDEGSAAPADGAALLVLSHPSESVVASAAPPAHRTLSLTLEEAELLCKVCVRYRRSLPIYLRAAQQEIEEIDALIARLR